MSRLLCLVCILACLTPAPGRAAEPLRVFVSVPPQRYLVERIGGEQVSVAVMLTAGESPETFDPGFRHISALNSARLYFLIGVAFETKWLESLQGNSQLKIVACCENLITGRSPVLDKHVWTSVRNLKALANAIKSELIALDAAHSALFELNYAELIAELEQLDNEIKDMLRQRRTDYFIVAHPALGHFADDYGLLQISLEKDGKEPGARSLITLIEQARRENIRSLFVQKQHSTATALAFAQEIGAKLLIIDPLNEDVIASLRHIASLLAEATR